MMRVAGAFLQMALSSWIGIGVAIAVGGAAGTTTASAASIDVVQPTTRAIFQRDPDSARIDVNGSYVGAVDRVEARAIVLAGYPGTTTDWGALDAEPIAGAFAGVMTVAEGGWYEIRVRALDDAGGTLAESSVQRIGVGELFVTAGQSNSANHGSPPLSTLEDRVSSHDLATGWRLADDPQPIATGSGGSPWPALGDLLVARYGVPVGFVSVGWGGTTVAQWLPGGDLYPRIAAAVGFLGPRGCRAVLWHQGESDTVEGTTAEMYAARLRSVIVRSRIDAGWDVPWGVALASFLPPEYGGDPGAGAEIIAGQEMVIGDPLVFRGAMTDDLVGPDWRHDAVHFNEPGLREHALRWVNAIPIDAPAIESIEPASGPIGSLTHVTIQGEGFLGSIELFFDEKPALGVQVLDSLTLTATAPSGEILGPVTVRVANEVGETLLADAFAYTPGFVLLGTAHPGGSVSYSAVGPPGGDWGAIVDYHPGPVTKKGLVWGIGFVDFEIIHDAFRLADPDLNGLGQGSATYVIPDDPTLIGKTLLAQAVFDGNGSRPRRILVLSEAIQTTIVP